jgi:hypothetical protein
VVVHLGIVVFLSPMFAGMNVSVIPWNFAIAVVGYWILMQFDPTPSGLRWKLPRWEKSVVTLFMLIPLGFYVGWVDRCFCHVMYSGNLPRGLITNKDGAIEYDSYPDLGVPFPHERRLFLQYFARTARYGDKLHIADPRKFLPDQYFVMRLSGPWEISAREFFDVLRIPVARVNIDEVVGVGIDDNQSLFALSQAGVKMLKKTEDSMVYAVAFTPENFNRSLLRQLKGLPNLQQLQFSGTDIRDDDLAALKSLRLLTGLGLNQTQITDQGLQQLEALPYLQTVESDGTAITKYPPER